MFEELLEKSYFYYDGSQAEAVQLKKSEKAQIQEELAKLYEKTEMTENDTNLLEKILIILFNYNQSDLVEDGSFRSQSAFLLFKEMQEEFSENS